MIRPSERQQQVITLTALGATVKEIAAELGIEYGTAHEHRMRAYSRLNLRNTADATRLAVARGWIQATDRYDPTDERPPKRT